METNLVNTRQNKTQLSNSQSSTDLLLLFYTSHFNKTKTVSYNLWDFYLIKFAEKSMK